MNLLMDIVTDHIENPGFDLENLSDDQMDGLRYALSTLKPREQLIVACRYEDGMTMREIGERFGVSNTRIGQLLKKCLVKLRNPVRFRNIKDGYSVILENQRKAHENKERVLREMIDSNQWRDISIGELDLTVRSYNCLTRAGIQTLEELLDAYKDIERFVRIRNLGSKSREEVENALILYLGRYM